uniref:Uncharacterized protein n=1 Tax=Anguilla anguilla TaxID=7936 RepID=A0A0E9VWZ4_ANGAN
MSAYPLSAATSQSTRFRNWRREGSWMIRVFCFPTASISDWRNENSKNNSTASKEAS